MSKGRIFIIAGPSGVGKNMIIDYILEHHSDFAYVPTYTDRPLRTNGDVDKDTRIVIDKSEFMSLARQMAFVEWKETHGWLYGKKHADIDRLLSEGKNLALEIDVKGIPQYLERYPDTCLIFIQFEDLKYLRQRLAKNRPDLSPEEIETRYQTALEEMKQASNFPHIVTNYEGRPEIAIGEVEKIINETLAKSG